MKVGPVKLLGQRLPCLLGGPFRAMWSLYGAVAFAAGVAAGVYVGTSSKDAATAAKLAVATGVLALVAEGFSGALVQWTRERVNSPTARAGLTEEETQSRLTKTFKHQGLGVGLRACGRAGVAGAAWGGGVVGVVRSDASEILTVAAVFAITVAAARTVAAERLSGEKLRAKARAHCAWSIGGGTPAADEVWANEESKLVQAWEDVIATRFWLALALSVVVPVGAGTLATDADIVACVLALLAWLVIALLVCGTAVRAGLDDIERPTRPADPTEATAAPSSAVEPADAVIPTEGDPTSADGTVRPT